MSRLISTPILRSSPTRVFSKSLTPIHHQARAAATASVQKRSGDISDAFASLSGGNPVPLDPRFATIKKRLIAGHEDALNAAWIRLLNYLRKEVAVVKEAGSTIIPEISFSDIKNKSISPAFQTAYQKRGVCVIRGVVSQEEALGYKTSLREYIAKNKERTKAFPAHDPQVYELYWSEAQLRARGHPNMLDTQRYLMSFWSTDQNAPVSIQHPVSYADRLRMRKPGDSAFALGPHIDGGSCERWEENGYGLGGDGKGVYSSIFRGEWEEFDPWDAAARLGVVSDIYGGVGACGIFRMAQGWLSMSDVKGGEGHLLVNPMLKGAMTYLLMRPFFEAIKGAEQLSADEYLHPSNWRLEPEPTPTLQGATPGHGQELSASLHPHLSLLTTMIHVPHVYPGDYVAWHCDTIHAVDKTHAGQSDSSVLYIPVCPLTEDNAMFLRRQREAFLKGTPSPDFGGGEGESKHAGLPKVEDVPTLMEREGIRGMGLEMWDSDEAGLTKGQREVMDRANKELGFYV